MKEKQKVTQKWEPTPEEVEAASGVRNFELDCSTAAILRVVGPMVAARALREAALEIARTIPRGKATSEYDRGCSKVGGYCSDLLRDRAAALEAPQ